MTPTRPHLLARGLWTALILHTCLPGCGGGGATHGGADGSVATPDSAVIPGTDGGVFTGGGQAPVAVDCQHIGSGRDIQVGNPAVESGSGILQVTSIGDVPWETLAAGDTVRIFHRSEPYREKFTIATSGTEAQPIRVCGVPSASGELPVLSGDMATTRSALGSVFGAYGNDSMQQRGIVIIRGEEYEERVEWITVEGLRFTGTMHAPYHTEDANDFVDWDGTTRPYDGGAAGIRVQKAAHLVIRGNEFDHLQVGVYMISQDLNYGEQFMIRDVLLEGNYFHDNALVADYNKHQAYIQGIGFTVQYNYFGSPIAGSLGNDLKMRTAGEVIRYNYFENGAHAIDLVDIEDFVGAVQPWQFAYQVTQLPNAERTDAMTRQAEAWTAYQATFVYGNLFHMVGEDAWPSVIHYGFDNSPFDRRPGTLYFYFNTLVYETDAADDSTMRVFDCCSDFEDSYYGDDAVQVGGLWHYVHGGTDYGPMLQQVAEDFPLMRAIDNVFVLKSHTPGQPRSDWEWNRWASDRVSLERNFITTGWDTQDLDSSATLDGFGMGQMPESVVYPGANGAHHVTGAETLITGAALPVDLQTFAPLAGGPLFDEAEALPSDIPASLHPTHQVSLVPGSPGQLNIEARTSLTTLGAIE